MWATVRPATKNNKLGRSKVARTTLVELDSQLFLSDANKYFKDEIFSVVQSFIKEMPAETNLDVTAIFTIYEWFSYIISFIVKKATASPTFVYSHGKASALSNADIVWSISNLPVAVYWQALFYSIHGTIMSWLDQEAKGTFLADMEEILSPYFDELEECSLEKLCNKYGKSCTNLGNWKDFTISREGILVLFIWMEKIFVMVLNKAGTRCSNNDMGKIFSQDIIWAFNWVRLTQVSSVSNFSSSDVKEPQITCNGQMMEKRKMKRKNKKNPLPYLPCHLIQSHILPKLPYDSLMRMKCVSKNWKEAITSGNFGRLVQDQQANQQIQSFGVFGGTCLKKEELKECDGLELVFIETTTMMDVYKADFRSSCNGLLCLFCLCVANPYLRIAVGNPVTGEWNLILYPDLEDWFFFEVRSLSLAVNSSNDSPSYKLVLQSCDSERNLFCVFSSGTSEWKFSKGVIPQLDLRCQENSVYVNGVLYWTTNKEMLVWFDIDRDLAGLINLPCEFVGYPAIGNWEQLDGEQRLTCSLCSHHFDGATEVKIYGLIGRIQWEKLSSVHIPDWNVSPFPYVGGNLQLVWENRGIVAYNIHIDKEHKVLVKRSKTWKEHLFAFKMNISSLPRILQWV